MIGNNFFDVMMHYRFTGGQSYVLLCTDTTLSNPPVVQPKSSYDVHLLRSPCISRQSENWVKRYKPRFIMARVR